MELDYTQVIADLESGVLDRDRITLVFDNDGGYWSYDVTDEDVENLSKPLKAKYAAKLAEDKEKWPDDFKTEDDEYDYLVERIADDKQEELRKKYGMPGGYSDVVIIANAAGIPAEWC